MALLTLLWAPLAVVWSLVQLLFLPSFWAGVAVTVALARSAASRRERQQARSRAVPALAECAPPTLKELKCVTESTRRRIGWFGVQRGATGNACWPASCVLTRGASSTSNSDRQSD